MRYLVDTQEVSLEICEWNDLSRLYGQGSNANLPVSSNSAPIQGEQAGAEFALSVWLC